MKKEVVIVCLYFELINRCDENVIVVQVKLVQFGLEELWNFIGYIFGLKVFKVINVLWNN